MLLLLSSPAIAFDSVDYATTMAQDALDSGQPAKALKLVNEALESNPNNSGLIELRKKARAAADQKKITDAQKERDRKAEAKQARQRHLAQQAEEEKKRWPGLLQETLCDCRRSRERAQHAIDQEKAGAAVSGMVDKVSLYQNGQAIVRIDKTLDFVTREMGSLGVPTPDCSAIKLPDVGVTCVSFGMEYKERIGL